jgi:hypothetical protein
MSPTSSQQWSRRIRYSDQHLRVSDAERSAVAERLATHYSDGRLDQAEFDERVGRAMSAKTRADLNGLFEDLPETGAPAATDPAHPAGQPRRRHRHPILLAALIRPDAPAGRAGYRGAVHRLARPDRIRLRVPVVLDRRARRGRPAGQ